MMEERDRRAELVGCIEKTRRLQRKMAYAFGALGVVALALAFWKGTVGGFALVIVGLVAIASFWVTAAHNAAHRQKLDELARTHGKGLPIAHRRWNT